MQRNLDPALHPFAKAREYTRALQATKMERMFAAPFVAQMGKGHVDGKSNIVLELGNLALPLCSQSHSRKSHANLSYRSILDG
jgi:hypothetical protein